MFDFWTRRTSYARRTLAFFVRTKGIYLKTDELNLLVRSKRVDSVHKLGLACFGENGGLAG